MASLYRLHGKRAFDLLAASCALVLLAPLLAMLALAVRITLGRPVLFRQRRPGRGGIAFTLYKLRTMRDAVDDGGRALPDGERLTTLGRLLRRGSLDELPELWNVVRGDMSLVGPRPLLPEYLARYSRDQARRHEILPGMTGLAQVNGRNCIGWNEKFRLDVWYVDNLGFALDCRILARTVWMVITGHGVNAPGAATAHPFEGAGPLP